MMFCKPGILHRRDLACAGLTHAPIQPASKRFRLVIEADGQSSGGAEILCLHLAYPGWGRVVMDAAV